MTPSSLKDGFSLAERLDAAPPPHALVGGHNALLDGDRHDLGAEGAGVLRGGGLLVRKRGELIELACGTVPTSPRSAPHQTP